MTPHKGNGTQQKTHATQSVSNTSNNAKEMLPRNHKNTKEIVYSDVTEYKGNVTHKSQNIKDMRQRLQHTTEIPSTNHKKTKDM